MAATLLALSLQAAASADFMADYYSYRNTSTTRWVASVPLPRGQAALYERDSERSWDLFYRRNGDRFFHDRHYLHAAFPRLVHATESAGSGARDDGAAAARRRRRRLLELGSGAIALPTPQPSTPAPMMSRPCEAGTVIWTIVGSPRN